MDLSAVITQLRQYCPALQVVGGAADFALGLETVVNTTLPAGYVIPLLEDAEDNSLMNGLVQQVTERCGVVLEIDNSTDRRGQTASAEVNDLKYAVFKALLNWRIDPIRAVRGIEYSGGRLLTMDRARLWYQLEFELHTTITDEDGFQVEVDDLTRIHVDATINQPGPPPEPGQPPVEVDIVLHPPAELPVTWPPK